MISYTVSTSERLQIVNALTSIADQRPAVASEVVNSFWDDLIDLIRNMIQPLLDGVVSTISGVINDIKNTITGIVTPIVNQVRDTVTGVIESITGGIGDAINSFITWLQNAINGINDWVQGAINTIQSTINNISSWLRDAISGIGSWITDAIENTISTVGGWVGGIVNEIGQWITDTYNNIKSGIVNTINGIGQWITDTYNNIKEWIKGVYDTVSLAVQNAVTTVEDWLGKLLEWLSVVRDALVKWFWQTVTNIAGWFAREVMPRFTNAVEGAQALIGIFSKVWEAISTGDFQTGFNIIDQLFKGLGIPAPVATLHSIVSALAYFWQTVNLQFIPMQVATQKQAEINLALSPVDMGTMATAVFKGDASIDQYYQNARIGAFTKERASIALEANRPLMSPGQVQQSFLRGEIDLNTHDALLRKYGLKDDYISLIRDLYMVIPGVSDLVRMAVREAFTPDIASKFGQYQDFPQDFALWAGKQGLSEEWSKRYWAAHWDLPSAEMGFDMLHRGVITNEELTLLLRALDVMPFWREKLIKLSYNPLTRVDVRRMYQLGVINEDQVKRAYLDIGYDDEKAGWLTTFTTKYYDPESYSQRDQFVELARGAYSQAFKRHLISEDEYRNFLKGLKYQEDDIDLLIRIDAYSMAQDDKLFDPAGYRKDYLKLVLNAYDRGLIHVNELKPMLIDMGYDPNEADLEINLADYNRNLKLRNMVATAVHDQYVSFIIDNVGCHTLLDQFNFTSEEIDKLTEEWNIERSLRTKRPPLSDLRKFLTSGLLTLDQFLDELRGEGYNERYIDLYARTLQPKGA